MTCPSCESTDPRIHYAHCDRIETYEITIHRSELIPGGNGARIGYSDDYPDKQFLIIPKRNPDGDYPDETIQQHIRDYLG